MRIRVSLLSLLIATINWSSSGAQVVSEHSLSARPLGELELVHGPVPCDEQSCYGIEVTCPEVSRPEQGWLKVGSPSAGPSKGTILITTGGPGTGLFDSFFHGQRVLNELRAAGFRTVQLQWLGGWLFATPGQKEGHARLACRPATAARWVYDNLHEGASTAPFCATGHSGGAAQVSYMLSHYGLEDILSAVVPTGGPPMSRMDLSCAADDPAEESLSFPDWARRLIDSGFGFPSDGSGPCAQGDLSYGEMFREASVASGDGDYFYPQTLVWFLFEEQDNTHAAAMGATYHDLLVSQGSPMVRKDVIPEANHGFPGTPEGADKIRDILLSECRLQGPPETPTP